MELNYFLCYIIDLYKTLPQRPWPAPLDGRPCIRLGRIIESTPQGGQTEHHGDDVCGESCVDARWISGTIPTVEKLRGGSFLFPPEPL